MTNKIAKMVAIAAIGGGSLLATVGQASAVHYCAITPSGLHQTNGNGNRGGGEWRMSELNTHNASDGIANAETAGALVDCTSANRPPASNHG